MTYQHIVSSISPEASNELKEFIAQGFVREAQVCLILEKAILLKKGSGQQPIQLAVGKLLHLLKILRLMDLPNRSPEAHVETIKRLISKNGHEAYNELVCHHVLLKLFKLYKIRPLFGDGPDGVVVDEGAIIPVEIKSRFPQKPVFLTEFLIKMASAFSGVAPHLDFFIQIDVTQIKGITEEICQQEADFFKEKAMQTDFDDFSFPSELIFVRTNVGLSYTMSLLIRKGVVGRLGLGTPYQTGIENIFFQKLGGQWSPNGFIDYCHAIMTLSDEVRKHLADVVINECIRNSKNIPDEPRVIAIYTSHAFGGNLFIKRVVKEYIDKHLGTMVIIVYSTYIGEEIGFYLLDAQHGSDLNGFVDRCFVTPPLPVTDI